MKKKVVIVGPAYPYRGGQSLVEAHLYDTMTSAGYDVQTVSFTLLYPTIFFPGTTQFDESKTTFFSHQDRIYRIINSINPFTWFKAIKKIRAINPDNTIFVWWMPFFGPAYWTIAFFLKRLTKTKITFLVENYISHENRWFDKFSSRVTLNLADYFICQSDFERRRIAAVHKEQKIFKTTLSVFDCYNMDRYDTISAREFLGIKTKRVIMFFGLIRRYKGLDKLIEAFTTIEKSYPDLTLLIVGECYEDIKYYEDLIEKEGIGDRTILINKFIANEDVEPYYKAADMVCLPYNSASQSGILMMAYGFKVPVLVNNVGGLPELIVEGKTGTVIPDNSPASIAKGVCRIYENGEKEDYETNIKNINESLGYINLHEMISEIVSGEVPQKT